VPVNDNSLPLLSKLSTQPENYPQAVRCLLLDVALLNSDRPATNVLIEADTRLWFFDHTGALWGSGYGDLGRTKLEEIKKKLPDQWFRDYLTSSTLNKAVWHFDTIADEVKRQLQALPLDPCHLIQASARMPSEWVPDKRTKETALSLTGWWSILKAFLEEPDAIERIRRQVVTLTER
jgi:hypothetical protein